MIQPKQRRIWRKALPIIVIVSVIFAFDIPEAEAAFASVGSLGTANDTTADTSFSFSPTATLNANNIGILVIAKDNESSTDGNTSECDSPTDSDGNTYTKLREFTNGQGAADAGATICVFFTKASSDLTNAVDSVTMTVTTGSVKAAIFQEFTVGAGNTIQVATGGATDLANDGASAGSMTLSELSSKEYLFFRASAAERGSIVWTPTANYTELTNANADTGNNNTSQTAVGEFRILTGTGDTSSPADTQAVDWASTYLALEEVAVAAPTTIIKVRLRGNVRLVGRLIRLR